MALSTTRTLLTQTGINTHQVFTLGGLDSSGIATFSNFKTGLSNLHSIGFDVVSNTGTGVTIRSTGNASFTGVITASKFVGDISDATGAAAGLGTALSQTQTDPHNKVYYTDKVLSISTTTTIDHPATANLAYTQYGDIKIEDGHDLIIKDGDDFKYDILGISTTKLADNYFQDGLTIGFGSSVKGDLVGNVTGNVTGNLTGNADTASGLSGNPSINTSGIITATSFSGSGANLTGLTPGITMAQQWRLRVITTVSSSYVTLADWEICDSLGSSSGFGGSMSLSGGVWTFPSTGIYHLNCQAGFEDSSNNQNFLTLAYNITTNNSSYTRVTESYGSLRAPGYENISAQYLLDVTDTSNVKFKITGQDQHGSGRVFGSTTLNYTTLTIMRLGDT